jgi:hypothetical protein
MRFAYLPAATTATAAGFATTLATAAGFVTSE